MKKENEFQINEEALQRYFQRIGLTDNELRAVRLDNLSLIHRQQVISIHVGNFAMQDKSRKKLDTPISVELKDIFQKLVLDGNHGYCFENNLLLLNVLLCLGYKARLVNAHIIRNDIPKEDPQHIVLLVSLGGKEYIVDAGYGGVAPIAVTEFTLDVTQTGPVHHWTTTDKTQNQYQLTVNGEWFKLSHYFHAPDEKEYFWKPLYQFKRTEVTQEEIEQSNLRVAVNKKTTPFLHTLFETRFDGQGGRLSITQEKLVVTKYGQTKFSKKITSSDEYKQQLRERFHHDEAGVIRKRVTFG